MSAPLEFFIKGCNNFDEFENLYSDELLDDDCQIGDHLSELLFKYDKPASKVSFDAHLAHSYVGNICNGKKNKWRIYKKSLMGQVTVPFFVYLIC